MDENLVNAELLFVSLIQASVTESKHYWEGQKCIYVFTFQARRNKTLSGGASGVRKNGGPVACPGKIL